MPDYSSDCYFSDYNPHFDRSTFLTILKSYNSYLANLKYWRKSLRSSIFTSSKKLKGTKGYSLSVFSALSFFRKKIPQRVPLQVFDVLRQNGCSKMRKGPPFKRGRLGFL